MKCLLARGDDKLCDIILVCDILYINNQSFLALTVACFSSKSYGVWDIQKERRVGRQELGEWKTNKQWQQTTEGQIQGRRHTQINGLLPLEFLPMLLEVIKFSALLPQKPIGCREQFCKKGRHFSLFDIFPSAAMNRPNNSPISI